MDAQNQTRSCRRERTEVGQKTPRGSRQICIPMDREKYEAIWHDAMQVREYLDQVIAGYPELFPCMMGTTVRIPERMPLHLAADEHHLDWFQFANGRPEIMERHSRPAWSVPAQ